VCGAFTPEQALVYETVRQAGEVAIASSRPGVEWRDVHRAAALVVADGLVELGVLRGCGESLVESGAVTLFFPHGVGHMVGLGVRHAGPASDERREPAPGQPRLRVDIPLAPRQAWTVEPGVYFVPALLARAVEAGASVVSEPAVTPWGQTVAYLRDNAGHLVELCTPLP